MPRPSPSASPSPPPSPSPAGSRGLPPRRPPPGRTPIVAPLLALVGLVVVGGISFWGISLLGLDIGIGAEPTARPVPGAGVQAGASMTPLPAATEDPDEAVPTLDAILDTPPPDERPSVKGTILFARGGNLWAASGLELDQLTSSEADASPVWSADGRRIYFIRTKLRTTSKTVGGGKYTLYVPSLMRMEANGRKTRKVYDALIKQNGKLWFSHLLQPDVHPNGKTVAVVSDGADGKGPVTLHTLSTKGGRLRAIKARSVGDLGHNDPEWAPDGKLLAYTHNRRDGPDGAPSVAIYDVKRGKVRLLRKGYANPSWAPDMEWLAAERTTGVGRDIVILDPRRGSERARLTHDGDSFAPVVSPDGDQIAYLHRDGQAIDLRVMTLAFDADGTITLVDDRAVTRDGAIDASSPPAWHIPKAELTPRLESPPAAAGAATTTVPATDAAAQRASPAT